MKSSGVISHVRCMYDVCPQSDPPIYPPWVHVQARCKPVGASGKSGACFDLACLRIGVFVYLLIMLVTWCQDRGRGGGFSVYSVPVSFVAFWS
jgi:hypothetical protein